MELRQVTFEYRSGTRRVRALEDVSLEIAPGEFVCVLGPSGCGKSTLLRIVAGLLQPTAGLVLVGGEMIRGPGAQRGIVLQQPTLYPWLNVYDNVALGPRLRGLAKQDVDEVVRRYLERVGLWEFRFYRPYELSGGMQQRVAIARALVNDPAVVLMDEPFGALDALTRERMQDLVLEIWRESRKTILLVTHSVEEAIFLGTRVVVLSARPGRVIAEREVRFSREMIGRSSRAVRSDPSFVALREEVLSFIWDVRVGDGGS